MADDDVEMIQKLAMYLDACMDLVAEMAEDERLFSQHGLKEITWQEREKAFNKLIDDARERITREGKIPCF